MKDPAVLHHLIAASVADPRREPEFLRALLTATLYLHIAGASRASGTRVIQFDRPDGIRVTPIFTTAERARVAAGGVVEVAQMAGRELLLATRGHVLMLDPNDTSCTLYPEEIEALLRGEAFIAPVEFKGGGTVVPADADPHRLQQLAQRALEPVQPVESLTLGRVGDTWLVIAGVPPAWAERSARALALALQSRQTVLGSAIDFTCFDPDQGVPGWYADADLRPFWSRTRIALSH